MGTKRGRLLYRQVWRGSEPSARYPAPARCGNMGAHGSVAGLPPPVMVGITSRQAWRQQRRRGRLWFSSRACFLPVCYYVFPLFTTLPLCQYLACSIPRSGVQREVQSTPVGAAATLQRSARPYAYARSRTAFGPQGASMSSAREVWWRREEFRAMFHHGYVAEHAWRRYVRL